MFFSDRVIGTQPSHRGGDKNLPQMAAAISGIRANSSKHRVSRNSLELSNEPFARLNSSTKLPIPQERIVNEVLGALMLDGYGPCKNLDLSVYW